MKKLLHVMVLSIVWIAASAQVPELIYYQFDNATSVINYASTPVGTNPAPIAGLTSATGGFLSSNALSGTGASSSTNKITTGWNTSITGSFTIGFWTSNVPVTTTLYYIFGDAGATSFRCFTNGVAGASNWMIRGAGLPDLVATGAATMAPHMIHFVYDATAGTYTSYVDGVLSNTVTASTTITATGTGLTVGGYSSSSSLSGLMDEFRWYNRALSATEIGNTYNVDLNFGGNCANAYTNVLVDSILSSSAKISWTPGTGNSSFWLEYGAVGFTPGSGTKITGTYPGTQPPVYLTGLSINTEYDYYLGEICNSGTDSIYPSGPSQFKTTKLCSPPTNITISNITNSGATVDWNYAGSSSNFTVLYGVKGTSPGSGGSVSATTTTYTFSNLNANTEYDIYVYSDCGTTNGVSDTTGPVDFLTLCGALTTPFTEDFDGITASNSTTNPGLPTCWSYYETPGHPGYGYTYTSLNPNSAPNHMRFYSSSGYGDTMMIISPPILELDSSNKQVVFWAKSNTASYSSPVAIGTMSDPTDPTTLDILATVMAPQNYTEFIVPIDASSGYNGTDLHIAIVCIQPASPIISLYVDDITVEQQPACPKPALITLGATTSSSQLVSWSSTGTSFNLEWGPTGFSQGTGQTGTSSTNTFTMTGLNGNTTYDVYIQNNCAGAGNGLSVWQGPVTFTTLCNAISGTIFEDFEAAAAGTTTNPSPPDCWTYVKTSHGGAGYGYTYNSATYAYSGTKAFRFYTSSNMTNGDTMGIVSPEVAGMTTTYKRIEFYARAFYSGTTYAEKLVVGTVANPGDLGSFVPLDTFDVSGTVYQYFVVNIDPANGYNGTHQYIAILDASDINDYPVIDDITISNIPACQPSTYVNASNISNVTANINWTPGEGLAYNIEFGPVGFTQGTGPVIKGITDTTYTLTGLTANTCYDVYVRDSCAIGPSPWVGPISFCTTCATASMPFIETFTNWPPSCFTITGDNTWLWSQHASGYAQALFWNYSAGTSTMLTQRVDVNTGAWVKFKWAHLYSASYPNDQLVVRAKATTATTWDTLVNLVGSSFNSPNTTNTTPPPSASDFIEEQIILDPVKFLNKDVDFQLIATTGFGPNLYVDEFVVEAVPSCLPPFNLGVTNITSSAATVNWSTINGTCYNLEYGPLGFIQGTGIGTVVNNVSNPYTITGLSPNTYYSYYVADCCNPNAWTGPFTFKTNCLSQLSGTYTVGGTPGATNFATLDSAISVLTGCGVSATVTFNLQGGTYLIPPTTFANITGVSATNTVTFNGGGVAVDTIAFGAGASGGLAFDGAQYITFQNMTINASSIDRPVWLYNNTHHIAFNYCDILGNATSTSALSCVIAATSTTTSLSSTGNNANYITVSHCKLSGGYYGFTVYGNSTTDYVNDFVLTDNEFVDQYYYGVRMYYADNITLERNNIHNFRNTFGYGYYGFYNSNIAVKQNEMFAPTYGMYISQLNVLNATSNSELSNNFMGGGTYGIYLTTYNKLNVYHNSFRGNTAGYYSFTPADVDIRNNIFVGGTSYAFYSSTNPATGYILNYNIYYTTGTTLAYNGAAQATLAAWQTAQPTLNVNSLQGDPGFISATDFHIVGTLPNNVGFNGLSAIDIDNDVRPATGSTIVDMGADEYSPLQWDATLEDLQVSLAGCGDSAMDVSVKVKNLGQNAITSLPVVVQVSGSITATLNFTYAQSIASGASATFSVGTINTASGQSGVNFTGYTNLSTDQKTSNDTMAVGPGAYFPLVPQALMPDTVCITADSATFAANVIPGLEYGWFANANDTVPAFTGGTLTFPLSGQQTWYLGYTGSGTQTLPTAYAGGNSCGGGAMFNITATSNLSIQGFDVSTTLATGTAVPLTVYYIPNGTYLGNELNAGAWTTHSSTTAPSAGLGNATTEMLPMPLFIPAGSTYAIYLNYASSYTNGTGANQVVSNADMVINLGIGMCGLFTGANNPRVFNGGVIYGSEACSQIKVPVTLPLRADSAIAAYNFTVLSNGADVNFDGSASQGQQYFWDFGDGGNATGVTTSHTYALGGTYTVCLVVVDTVCNSADTSCKQVLVTVGIDEGLIGQTLNLYPNPNDGNFRVEFQVEGLMNIEMRLTTLLGQEIYASKPGNISGEYRQDIDLSNQAAGVYILQIISDSNIVSRRITIRK